MENIGEHYDGAWNTDSLGSEYFNIAAGRDYEDNKEPRVTEILAKEPDSKLVLAIEQ